MEAIDRDIERFLHVETGDGYGYGSGSGYGDGDGDGSGYGAGDGDGDGDGDGYGYGDGYGDGDGSGDGDGDGSGYGDGDGSGIEVLNGHRVYMIDDTPTIIYRVFGGVHARGAILNSDLTLTPCYIYRKGDCFAHGDTLKQAVADAVAKWQESRPLEERLAEFVRTHPDLDTPYGDLFAWHHTLTGSCEAGRRAWCKDHGLQPTDSITVRRFIDLTINNYGRAAIRRLAEAYHYTP